MVSRLIDFFKIGYETLLTHIFCLLHQHLAVSDDGIHGGA